MRITNIYGKTEDIHCIACDTLEQSNDPKNKFFIAKSKHFRAEQDFEVPIPGFVIIASDRHFYGLDEMSETERMDFIHFAANVRKAMRQALNVEYVQVVLDEHTTSSHFHLWLFPRYAWMDEKFSTKLRSIPEIMNHARENMKDDKWLREVDEATLALKRKLAL